MKQDNKVVKIDIVVKDKDATTNAQIHETAESVVFLIPNETGVRSGVLGRFSTETFLKMMLALDELKKEMIKSIPDDNLADFIKNILEEDD